MVGAVVVGLPREPSRGGRGGLNPRSASITAFPFAEIPSSESAELHALPRLGRLPNLGSPNLGVVERGVVGSAPLGVVGLLAGPGELALLLVVWEIRGLARLRSSAVNWTEGKRGEHWFLGAGSESKGWPEDGGKLTEGACEIDASGAVEAEILELPERGDE